MKNTPRHKPHRGQAVAVATGVLDEKGEETASGHGDVKLPVVVIIGGIDSCSSSGGGHLIIILSSSYVR